MCSHSAPVCLFKIQSYSLCFKSASSQMFYFFYKNNPKLLNSCHPLRVKRSKTNVEPLRSFDRKCLSSYYQLNSMYFHIYFQGTLTKPSERRQSP